MRLRAVPGAHLDRMELIADPFRAHFVEPQNRVLRLFSMSRWKFKGALRAATSKPVSGFYEAIEAWTRPLDCLLVDRGGVVKLNAQQLRLLSASGFGSSLIVGAVEARTFPGSNPEAEDGVESHFLQLTLEEAFYLCYELHCLSFYKQSPEGSVRVTQEQAWSLMLSYKPDFAKLYKCYSHLRNKRWIVRPGPQYGADFMAYRHHPALVHSDYAVLVLDDHNSRMNTWSDVQAMSRLCGSVAKVLLLLYVIFNDDEGVSSLQCLDKMFVEEVEVKRWLPEKHRQDV